MSWLLFALLNIVGSGTALFIIKTRLTKKIPYAGIMFVSLFVAALGYLPFILPQLQDNFHVVSQPIGFFWFLLGLSTAILGFFLYTKALSLGDLSVVGPLDTTRPFFVVIFSMLILHQMPTRFLLIGILAIFFGALILTIKKKFWETIEHIKNSKEILFILASTATFALESIFDKKTLLYMQPIEYSFLLMLGVSIFFGIQFLTTVKKAHVSALLSPVLIGSGLLWTVAYFGNMFALRLASPNVVIPVLMTRSLYLSILGFLFLEEKGYIKKILAAALMLLGVFLITR